MYILMAVYKMFFVKSRSLCVHDPVVENEVVTDNPEKHVHVSSSQIVYASQVQRRLDSSAAMAPKNGEDQAFRGMNIPLEATAMIQCCIISRQ